MPKNVAEVVVDHDDETLVDHDYHGDPWVFGDFLVVHFGGSCIEENQGR